ncbi:MAG: IS110 family transposase [Acidilobaceae archaeon]|nr:IS110 family transposase [Acidilobaceae archaeon]
MEVWGEFADLAAQVRMYEISQRFRIRVHNMLTSSKDENLVRVYRPYLDRFEQLENYAETYISDRVKDHHMYLYMSKIKGLGPILIAKLIIYLGPDSAMERRVNVSQLWSFAGLTPSSKLEKGKKAPFNKRLRSLLYVVGTSFLRAKSPFTEVYYHFKDYYSRERPWTPQHVHLASMRKMGVVLLYCLWKKWRENLSLPTRPLYVVEKLGHTTVWEPEYFIRQ